MPKRNRQKDRETFFWMKTPVIIITGLAVSIFPAVVIITQERTQMVPGGRRIAPLRDLHRRPPRGTRDNLPLSPSDRTGKK